MILHAGKKARDAGAIACFLLQVPFCWIFNKSVSFGACISNPLRNCVHRRRKICRQRNPVLYFCCRLQRWCGPCINCNPNTLRPLTFYPYTYTLLVSAARQVLIPPNFHDGLAGCMRFEPHCTLQRLDKLQSPWFTEKSDYELLSCFVSVILMSVFRLYVGPRTSMVDCSLFSYCPAYRIPCLRIAITSMSKSMLFSNP